MRRRWIVPIALPLLAAPAALADIGPHSSLYDQSKLHAGAQRPDVSVLLDRRTHIAVVDVQNYCLGAQFDGGQRFPNTAEFTVRVRDGKLSFHGTARVIRKPRPATTVGTLVATVRPRKVSGHVRFPRTDCGTIRFVAPLVERKR